jgi:hypothetical protein
MATAARHDKKKLQRRPYKAWGLPQEILMEKKDCSNNVTCCEVIAKSSSRLINQHYVCRQNTDLWLMAK